MDNTLGEKYLWEAWNRIDEIPDNLLNRLWSLKKRIRKRAFQILQNNFWDDINLFQIAPIAFLEKQDTDAAISFIIAAFEQKKEIDFKVFEQVYYTILSELEFFTSQNNEEVVENILKKLQLLLRWAILQAKYKENNDFLCLLYNEKIRVKDFIEAESIAQELIEKNYPLGYLFLWMAYSNQSLSEKALEAFINGWEKYKIQNYLESIVSLSYEMWDLAISKKYYDLWIEKFSQFWYFIEYSKEITSWEEFELFIKEIFPHKPWETTKKLLESAIVFLQEELLEEQNQFNDSKNDDPRWAIQSLYQSVKIGYYLSEYSQEAQWLLLHIQQLQKIWNSNNPYFHELLEQFLDEFTPVEVQYDISWKEETDEISFENIPNWEKIEVKNKNNLLHLDAKLSLQTHLFLHIQTKMKTFISYENQWILTHWVFPFLHTLLKQIPENEQQENIQNKLEYTEKYIEKEASFFANFSENMKNTYKDFIQQIDEEYGVFIRRNTQSFAKNLEFPEVMNNVELLVLHCIELLISCYITNKLSHQNILAILNKYQFFSLPIDEKYLIFLWELFATFEEYEAAMQLFIHTHVQFQDDISLYHILKAKAYMTEETFSGFSLALKEKLELSESVSEYIENCIADIEDSDFKNLCEWAYKMVFPKMKEDMIQSENNFHKSAKNGNIDGILWLAKVAEILWDKQKALFHYQQANEQESSNPRYLKECLRMAFALKDEQKIISFMKKASLFWYRDFETEYFMYLLDYKSSIQAIEYAIASQHQLVNVDVMNQDIFHKIYAIATRDSLASKEWYREKLSAQVLLLLQNRFQIPHQILFLSTLLEIPDEHFLELSIEIFGKMYDNQADKNIEILLQNVHIFSESIAYNNIDDETKLPLIRDFYYHMIKLLQRIPGWEKQAEIYMKKMDIPYVKGNFSVLPNELSSTLYH